MGSGTLPEWGFSYPQGVPYAWDSCGKGLLPSAVYDAQIKEKDRIRNKIGD